ncbi:conserved hypothetical protein [Thiobacillus denitrificans ATCC 25259]|uniref:Uncharacterized protein n=1 Tax=Thiobacillus denitrificans (strain ATCC 25259 / T1) TaxID=292415 RepID=Q3SLT6_THIDA|nr:hypothetical protein [Thiobacillus denitrificans]AAZ96319.1 conserved hypothetical protein [Thiobacillus denitrificans ATCC 25259]
MIDDTNKPADAAAPPATNTGTAVAAKRKAAKPATTRRTASAAKTAPTRKRPKATPSRKVKLPAAATKPAAAKQSARAAKPAASKKADKPVKAKKVKLVRDSFTMPETEYALIAELKKRCLNAGVSAKKSEILRAAVAGLAELSDSSVVTAIRRLEVIKTGRPAKAMDSK